MSKIRERTAVGEISTDRKPIDEYNGAQGYIDWIRDYLGVELTEPQKEMVRAFHNNQKTLIVAGNGFGKTYCLACLTLAFLFTNYPASILATSGTYSKMRRTYCRPIKKFHQGTWGLPGRYLKSPPRIELEHDPDVFWEADSPRDPGELEGVHNKYTMGIVEEADKEAVNEELFESLSSLVTDDKDKLIAVANPPKDETNVVYDLMNDDSWTLKQFSSFDSHNVRIELGEAAGEHKEGLVTLDQIKQDWESWNVEPWPGVEEARRSHEREDLDVRWYRRRMGVISPKASHVPRPFTVEEVEDGFEREKPAYTTSTPQGLAWDVARGHGDYNVVAGVFGRDVKILDYWHSDDHAESEARVRDIVDPSWSCPFAIDSVGVGSGSADHVDTFYPDVVRFNAGGVAADPRTYADRWTEGLCMVEDYLNDGAKLYHDRLREEMLTAARVIRLEEKYTGKYDTTRYEASSKGNIKDRLGRSPDMLDAVYMAVLMAEKGGSSRRSISSSW